MSVFPFHLQHNRNEKLNTEILNTETLNEETIGNAEDYIKESDIVKDIFPSWDDDITKHHSIAECVSCGKPFYSGSDHYFCPACAEDRKINKPAIEKICKDCGIKFWGYSSEWRCPKCMEAAREESYRKYWAKGGTERPMGSTDKCILCGKEYTVTSSSQKYCSSECRKIAFQPRAKARSREYYRTSEWSAKNKQRRKNAKKICVYCLQPFTRCTRSNTCSDYCRAQHKKLKCHESRIRNGKTNMYKKLVEERNLYREQVQNDKEKKAEMSS